MDDYGFFILQEDAGDAQVGRAVADGQAVTRFAMRERADRRAGDGRSVRGLFRRLMSWVFAQWEPVPGGRLVLLAAGWSPI